MNQTPFMRHRAICEDCRTMPHPCEVGAEILRRTIEQRLSEAKTKEEPWRSESV